MIIKFIIIVVILLMILFISYRFQMIVMTKMPIIKYFLIIGIFVHEMSHAIACLLTGTRITKIHFSFYEGYVEHEHSKIPIIGPIFISIAPMIFGSGLIFLILYYFAGIDLNKIINISQNTITINPSELWQFTKLLYLNHIENWIIIFLLINLTMTYIPSKQDFKNIYESIAGYTIIIIIIAFFQDDIPRLYNYISLLHTYIIFVLIIALMIISFFYILVSLMNISVKAIERFNIN